MKSNLKKRILAAVLCMVMVFSGSSFAMAGDADTTAENGTEVSQDTGTTTTSSGEESQEQTTSGETGETTEGTQETGEQTETTTPETTTPDTTAPETTTGNQETETAPATEEPVQSPAYDGKYEDDTVTISVSAEAGIVPEGAELSVTPIEKTEITDDMSEEDKAKAEEINAQYDLTEKKLNEDSAENEETMEGFLAYDISFLINGEEVEPSGDVKVVMDFKEAAIPEGVSEDAAVAVKHLKEDENAEDGVVVEDMAEKADVQTTDKAEVEKVELTSDSFSTYTITWNGGVGQDTLTIKIVDAHGNAIGSDTGYFTKSEFNWSGENTVTVDTILDKLIEKNDNNSLVNNDTFKKAVYGENGDFSFSAPEISAFKYKSSQGKYEFRYEPVDKPNSWNSIDSNDVIYFIFGDDPELSFAPISTESTIDTIDINLFDYQVGSNGDESADWNNFEGINSGHALKFVDDKGSNNHTVNINQDGGSGKINSGMVENKLVNGYPKLSENKEGSDGKLLDYLFCLNGKANVKSVYSGLDKLFTIDEDGYHVFDSDENYAYLKNDGSGFAQEFTVGNIVGQGSPGFYPFSQPTSSTIADIKKSSDEATLGYTGVNHYYGMTIETSFIQPKGGKINNNQDMVFEFSGDDDVWVFIDDVLVLDLGGIHGAVSGTINFADGTVTRTDIKGGEASGTTLKQAFENAGVSVELESTGGFADYSTHTIKFFYLERGNFDSNCMIKFNFPTIPKDSVAVAKEVTDTDGEGIDYADDIDFKFNLKVGGDNYSSRKYALWENGSQVLDQEGKPIMGETDTEGNFTLKHSQMAVFSNIEAGTEYQVTELGAYLNGYTVYIDGTKHEVNPNSPSGITVPSVQTGMLTVGEDQSVVFRNEIKDRATLNITKQLAEGEESTNKKFQIKLKIQGVEYKGYYRVNNTPGYSTDNGIIELEAGQTATITGLPYGVSFEVEEMLDGSYLPTYSVSGNGLYNVTVPTENNDQSAVTGNINGDGTVTVTNAEVVISDGKTDVTVTKTWDDNEKYSNLIPDYIEVTLYEDTNHNQQYDEEDKIVTENALGNPIVATVKLTADGWTHTWSNLPADTDFVITETYPEGFEWKTTEYGNSLSNLTELDRVTTCKNLTFDLGKNNMLLVKKTDGYYLWSVYDLKLTEEQIKSIAQTIKGMRLEGAGNLTFDNLGYDWGISPEDEGITLTETSDGWTLKFAQKSVWAQFWNLQYDRTENISLVNQIDQDLTTEVTVDKKWGNYQGESVTVQLVPTVDEEKILTKNQINWDGNFEVTLNTTSGWTYTYENLPFYYYDSEEGKYKEINYSITEKSVTVDGTVIELTPGEINLEGYVFDVTMNSKNDFTITNNKISEWEIVKVSSTDSGIPQVLGGAEFILTKQGDPTPSYYGATYDSDNYYPEDATEGYDEGKVYWWKEEAHKGTIAQAEKYIEDGTYILKERKAPDGYLVNPVTWTIKIENLEVVSITDSNGQPITKYTPVVSTRAGIRADRYLFEDTPIYELPSAGGPGIYWYTIGGILLMIAGTLVLYKNKRREVLKR